MNPPINPPDTPSEPPSPPPSPATPRRGGWIGLALTATAALGLLGLLGVTLLGRSLRAPPALLTLLVTFLPYLYTALAVIVFALWSLLPDRKVLPGLLAAVLVAMIALWGPAWRSQRSTEGGISLRVMEWNVRRLWGGPDDGGDAQACVVQHIDRSDPDVLVLLEIDRNHLDRLQSRLNLSCTHVDYRGTGLPQLGGLAICTRGARWQLTQAQNYAMVDGDTWQYLFAEIEGSGSRFNVLAAHLHPYHFSIQTLKRGVGALARGRANPLVDLNRTGRRVVVEQGRQSQALLRRVQRFRDPTLLVGDFNSVRDAALHVSLRRFLVDTWEVGGRGFGSTLDFSGWIPLRVDYIYATKQFAVTESEVLDVGCSDHRPVISNLNLSAQDLVSPDTDD